MGTFTNCCPHCDYQFYTVSLQNEHRAFGYANHFEFDCPECRKAVHVEVHPVPEFELSKGRET